MTDHRLSETLRELHPPVEPSQALIDRVSILAEGTTSPSRRTLSWSTGISVTLAAAAVAGFGFFLTPRATLARTLQQVSQNLANTNGAYTRITLSGEGKEAVQWEQWYREGKWRQDVNTDGNRLVQIKDGTRFWNYSPADHTAWFQADDTGMPSPLIRTEEFQSQIRSALSGAQGKSLGSEMRNGRRLQKVALPGMIQPRPFSHPIAGRTLCWIDMEKLLPVIMEQQVRQKEQWVSVWHMEFDFEHPVAPATFMIPPDVRCYDVNSFGATVGNRFLRPLAEQRFRTRTIALRDVQMNQEGDVFVLYTDGSTRDQNRETYPDILSDDRGTRYSGTAGGIEPFMYNQDKRFSRGITVNGEVMRGWCQVPETVPLTTARPKKITVGVHFIEQLGKKAFTRTARFTVPLPPPATALLPTYAHDLTLLSLEGGNSTKFRQAREWGRRAACYNRQDWAGMIRLTDQAIGKRLVDVQTYLDRAKAFHELGQLSEMRAAFAAADSEDHYGFYKEIIQQTRQELTNAAEKHPSVTR